MGPWYRKVNDRIREATQCTTVDDLIVLLGEPDKKETGSSVESPNNVFQKIGSSFRFGEEPGTVFTYVDPYRPRHRYKFGITGGRVTSCWRETVDESNQEEL